MPARAKIGCMGELLVEFVCAQRNGRHLVPGSYTGPFPSGAPGIFIDQAARVGGKAVFVGAVGDDAFGQVLLERLRRDGVETSLIAIAPGIPTGTAFVSYNEDGSRDFVYNIAQSAASRFETGEVMIAKLVEFGLDVMHVSGSALGDNAMAAKIVRSCQALHGKGVRISFDPNIRKELMGSPAYLEAVRTILGLARIFLPSEEDAAVLFPGQSLDEFAAGLFATGIEHVVLKRGERGAAGLARTGERAGVMAHKVDVVDPTGAGDCFCATFVTLLASGSHDFGSALVRANAAGALAVGKLGPMEGNSTLAGIEAFLAARK